MTLTRYFVDANEFLAAHNHAGAALVVIEATKAGRRAGWTAPPGWARMTTRQRMEALGWMASPIVAALGRDSYKPGGYTFNRAGYERALPLLRG